MEGENKELETLKKENEKLTEELKRFQNQGNNKKKNNYYSHYKAAHHTERIAQLKKGGVIYPVFVQIDLINACNIDCSFCSYKLGNYSSDQIKDFDRGDKLNKNIVFRILREMKKAGVKAVEWSGGGEPTLHPDWKDIVKVAKELGYEQALVTNGTLLDDEGIDLIKDFEWVRFSIDASTEETYNQVKRKPELKLALENLKRLVEIKNPENIVGVSFVVCKENYHEIHEAARLAKTLGADNIRFSLAYTPQGKEMFDGIWDNTIEQIEKAKQEKTEDFKVFAFPNRIDEISQKTKSDACYFHEFVATIGANGAVYPCCLLKYNPKFNFGNLNDNSFEDIWFGDKRKEFVGQIRRGCNYSCWMTDKNNFISYFLERNPSHVNFI